MVTILSRPNVEIFFTLYPTKCFLSNIQKLGAFNGLGLLVVVK